jgi:hypothetical protein
METITSVAEIKEIVEQDEWMMTVLNAAQELHLPDWWIGAGFLRNRVWDYLQHNQPKPSRDIDLVYFDSNDVTAEKDWEYDENMNTNHPSAEWEVRNQARMHYKNGFEPFTSTADGIAHWTETATAVAVRLNQQHKLEFLFCYGTDDLFGLIARPTPYFMKEPMLSIYRQRMAEKNWQDRWPAITILEK